MRSIAERVRVLGAERGAALLEAAGYGGPYALARDWRFWARPEQRAPEGNWRTWLVMAGRGFGKTRSGAEWVHEAARGNSKARIAIVGATMAEARAVMVEGASGLIATARAEDELLWAPSLNRLIWGSGATAKLFSAAAPESLRGGEHHFAWADEVGKWGADATNAWDNLMLTLRKGARPRVVATTTPRATDMVRRLVNDPHTAITRGRTADNHANLSPVFRADMEALYGGTRLGAQELDGELIEDVAGALWTRAMIEGAKEAVGSGAVGNGGSAPNTSDCLLPTASLMRIVVAVDPPASATGDACGIVACGIDADGVGHVLDDASVENASPQDWARAVSTCVARWGADKVIAEANNGGDMVRATLLAHDATLPVRLVHARHGKGARAEPVALLYEQARVRHRRPFPLLEDQLCGMTAGGYEGPGRSPDRADALVWGLTELMLKRRGEPGVRWI